MIQARIYSVAVASGITLSSAITMEFNFRNVYLEVPTMASGSLYLQGSSDGSTFRRIVDDARSSGSAPADFVINSASTNRILPIPKGMKYLKIESSSGATDVTTTFKVICS